MSGDEDMQARAEPPAGAVIREDATGRLYLKTGEGCAWYRELHGESVSSAPYAPGGAFTVLWPIASPEGEQ